MTESIKDILIRRDNMTEVDADNLIAEAKQDLFDRLDEGEQPDDFCAEWFGLEPDYIIELL